MRFPLRLTADLALHLAGQPLRGKARRPLIVRCTPVEEAGRSLQDSVAPVAWIGGAEPLLHPVAAPLTRSLLDRSRHVFLQTDGNLLRRRIHEFQPRPRFFLALEFHGLETSHDLRVGRKGAFQVAVEAIRAAKLSGFFTCAYTAMDTNSDLDELQRLRKRFQTLKMDGWVIVPASGPSSRSMCKREAARQNLAEARKLIPSRRWQLFSELLESAAAPLNSFESLVPEFAEVPQSESGVRGESVQAP
jgi:MoaA/NifB/PqqE/SkfB family radical SAM enzyme